LPWQEASICPNHRAASLPYGSEEGISSLYIASIAPPHLRRRLLLPTNKPPSDLRRNFLPFPWIDVIESRGYRVEEEPGGAAEKGLKGCFE